VANAAAYSQGSWRCWLGDQIAEVMSRPPPLSLPDDGPPSAPRHQSLPPPASRFVDSVWKVVAEQRQDKQQQPPPSASQMSGFDECTLWVGHIPAADASMDVLARVFSRHGEVKSVEVREKVGKSWALVTYAHAGSCAAALGSPCLAPSSQQPLRVGKLDLGRALHSHGSLCSTYDKARKRAGVACAGDVHQSGGSSNGDGGGCGGDGGADAKNKRRRGQGDSSAPLAVAAAFQGSGTIDDIAEVERISFIAKGTSGSVFRARWNGMQVAAKFFTGFDDPQVHKAFDTELVRSDAKD
jgi:hypothetical protein